MIPIIKSISEMPNFMEESPLIRSSLLVSYPTFVISDQNNDFYRFQLHIGWNISQKYLLKLIFHIEY